MLYPQTSPSAPVSRDDLARLVALQQMQFQRGPGALDPEGNIIGGQNSASLGSQQPDIFPHSPASSPDLQTGFGPFGGRGGEGREGFGEGVADPALGSPTGSPPDPGAVAVSGFNPSGATTSPSSQAAQDAGRAALADAALAGHAATTGFHDPGSFTGRGGKEGEGFGTFTEANPTSSNTFADRWGGLPTDAPTPDYSATDRSMTAPGWATGTPTMSFADRWGGTGIKDPSTTTPEEAGVNTPGWDPGGAAIASIMAGVGGWGSGGGSGRGGAATGAVDNTGSSAAGQAAIGSIMSGVGGWGGGGFSQTGGYEGSASMSNTGGAQGFGGGAVGGFGGGAADPGGGGDTSGGGGGQDAGGSPGGVG